MLAGRANAGMVFSVDNSSAGRAYLLQYIALMLLLLSFNIGVFGSASLKQERAQVAPLEAEQAPASTALTLTQQEYADAFVRGERSGAGGALDALAQLLREHDLSAQILINAAAERSSLESDLSLALIRARTLYQSLRGTGVPASAIHLLVVREPGVWQLRYTLWRGAR